MVESLLEVSCQIHELKMIYEELDDERVAFRDREYLQQYCSIEENLQELNDAGELDRNPPAIVSDFHSHNYESALEKLDEEMSADIYSDPFNLTIND